MPADSYITNKQVILWTPSEHPVQVTNQLNLPDFTLTNFTTTYAVTKSATGEYSLIQLNLVFKRETSYYLMAVYAPVTMLVIVSYLSFFIGVKEQFLKFFISLLCLSTLIITVIILNKELPCVSYTKAFDVWLGTCMTFIFAALIESVVVYLFNRNDCDKKTELVNLNDSADKKVSYSNN